MPNWPSEKPNWLFLSRRQFNQFTLNGTFVGEPENIGAMQWVIFSFIPASRGVWQQSLYGAGTISVYSGSWGNYESEVSWALFCGRSSVTYLRKPMPTSQYPQQFVYPADVFSTVHHLYWWHLHSANFISRHTSHPVSTKAEAVTLFHHPLLKQWTEAKIYYTEQPHVSFSIEYTGSSGTFSQKRYMGFQKPIWEWCWGTPPRPWLTFRLFKLVTYKPTRRVYTLHRLWHDW